MHGEGKISYSGGPKNGRTIEGQFKNGKWDGLMYVQSENGDKKFCEFVEDKAHGFGLNEYEGGAEYQGEFHNDKKHGYAVYRNKQRDLYTGMFLNGDRHGLAVVTSNGGVGMDYVLYENGKRIHTFTDDEVQKIKEGSEDYKSMYS